MADFVQTMRDKLPAARSPSIAEYKEVADYVDFVIKWARSEMPRTAPKLANNWFFVLAYALNETIKLRENTLGDGALLQKYGIARRENFIAYADHYLQMRADAFNLGPTGKAVLLNSVYNYDLAKVLRIAPSTGPAPVSPATELSIFWGLQGIEDGLADDRLEPSKTGYPRQSSFADYEYKKFIELGFGVAVAGAIKSVTDLLGPRFGDSWRR